MKQIHFILICTIGILIIPIFSLLFLSFQDTNGELFKWYISILSNPDFRASFSNSFAVSILTGLFTIIIGFILSLSYFNGKTRAITVFFILVMGLMPPDIISISINKLAQIIGFQRSNLFFLFFSLLLYCLPFSIIILWTRYYFIERNILIVSEDLGMNNRSIILKVLVPLSKTALISSFLFAFLLSFNEYPRTFYLSGSTVYLSEYLNGKLSSGADNSIYAGGAVSILITCLVIIGYAAILKYRNYLQKKTI